MREETIKLGGYLMEMGMYPEWEYEGKKLTVGFVPEMPNMGYEDVEKGTVQFVVTDSNVTRAEATLHSKAESLASYEVIIRAEGREITEAYVQELENKTRQHGKMSPVQKKEFKEEEGCFICEAELAAHWDT